MYDVLIVLNLELPLSESSLKTSDQKDPTILYILKKNFLFKSFLKKIYLFIYGCVGSLFLCEGFL